MNKKVKYRGFSVLLVEHQAFEFEEHSSLAATIGQLSNKILSK